MKYYAEKGSDIGLAVRGSIFARATGSIGFTEAEQTMSGKITRLAIGYREDHIPANHGELVEITQEIIDSELRRQPWHLHH